MSVRSVLSRTAGPLIILAVLTTAACSSGSTTPTAASSSSSGTGDLSTVSVTGAAGAKPTVKMPTPFSVTETRKVVLTKGTGPAVGMGQKVTVDYTGFNGADGKEFVSSQGQGNQPASFLLDPKEMVLPGLIKGLVGQTVGSRVLVAIPPVDGYGTKGAPQAKIGPTDTILVVVDIKSAKNVLKRAAGTPVAPRPGLPTVKLGAGGKPSITLPAGNPPGQLVIQPLITGKGTKVAKGQQITVQYTGIIWPGGKQFDSSWDKGAPATFGIGVGQVIAGWDEGLVGRPVGSQMLLVIPPDKGYGAQGQGQIKGTDTLVFVVDILDAT